MRALMAAIALAGITNATLVWGQIYSGQTVGAETSLDWSSFMVSHDTDVRIRATTVNSVGAAVYLDFMVPSCALYLQLNLPFSRPSDTDIDSVKVPVSLRVDANDTIPLQGTMNPVAMGDANYILTVSQIGDFASFAAQMSAGQVLRVKEGFPGAQQFYYSFSLRGFSGAFRRAGNACDLIAKGTSPPSTKPPATVPRRRGGAETPADTAKWF